jgi:hypothetical protein
MATLVGALFLLSLGLPVVQAGEMALSVGGGELALEACPDCDDKGDSRETEACMQMCSVPAMDAFPIGVAPSVGPPSAVNVAGPWALNGRAFAPDPHPPRRIDIS